MAAVSREQLALASYGQREFVMPIIFMGKEPIRPLITVDYLRGQQIPADPKPVPEQHSSVRIRPTIQNPSERADMVLQRMPIRAAVSAASQKVVHG
jgi:hypothetical protein